MRRSALLCGFVFCAATATAHAGTFFNGNQFHEWLAGYERFDAGQATGPDEVYAARTMAYVAGVNDAMDGIFVCAPRSTTIAQEAAIVEKYLRDHPERWGYSADSLVAVALHDAFPCKPKQASMQPSMPAQPSGDN